MSSIGPEWFVESFYALGVSSGWDAIATEKDRVGKKRKGTAARPSKTVPGIINCRDDLITRLNELPAAASRSCRRADTFSSFEENGAERRGKNCSYRGNDLSRLKPRAA